MQKQDDEQPTGYTGRTKISDNRRQNFSKRAAKGNILIEKTDKPCKKCGKYKIKTNMSAQSPIFLQKKCTKCGAKR